jgi:hypothetical protein
MKQYIFKRNYPNFVKFGTDYEQILSVTNIINRVVIEIEEKYGKRLSFLKSKRKPINVSFIRAVKHNGDFFVDETHKLNCYELILGEFGLKSLEISNKLSVKDLFI